MNTISRATIAAVAVLFSGHAFAGPISNSNAIELAAHRVEKLVILKKIDSGFLNHLSDLALEIIPDGGVGKATFKITGSQQADSGKVANQVEIILDEKGKPVSYQQMLNGPATSPVAWPDKDPVTLLERGIHYLEDNVAAKPELSVFNRPMKSVRISPANIDGKDLGLIEVLSYESPKVLRIVIGLNAKVLSVSVD